MITTVTFLRSVSYDEKQTPVYVNQNLFVTSFIDRNIFKQYFALDTYMKMG